MRTVSWTRFGRIAVATAMLVSTAIGWSAGSAQGASVTFGTPSASSKFGQGVDFTQPYSGGGTFAEVDIVITYPGNFGPSLIKLTRPGSGSFTYQLDTTTGQLQPNTQLVAHFQVTATDGTVQDGPDIHVTYLDDRFQWHTKLGTIVRLHWYQGDDSFAQQALQMGEQGIAQAASYLGFKETAPIDFYVYADQTPFYDALGPGTRENVGGEANTDTRTLFALIAPGDLSYAASVVPHELTHVVFDEITHNPYHSPPHWLNEGVAVYVSQGFDDSDRQLVQQAASDGTLMPLAAIRGQFPTTQDRFYLAYGESVSAVDFFIRKYGHDALVKLLKAFGTGASDDEAFTAAIGLKVDAFDTAWRKANGVTDLKSFGPQPAPAGPVPPGWVGPAPTQAATQAPASVPTNAAPSTTAPARDPSRGHNWPILVLVVAALSVSAAVLLWASRSRATSRGPR